MSRSCVAVLLLAKLSHGCAFARSGGALPAGHVSVDSGECPNAAPGVPYLDAAGEASVWPDLPYNDFYLAKYIANMSIAYNTPLCYVSMQVLPSPPNGTVPGGKNCTWSGQPSYLDVLELYALGSQAIARMQALVDARWGAFRGSVCGGGSTNAKALCAEYPTSEKCAPAVLGQLSPWAVATNIVEITEASLRAVIANDTTWRASPDWHVPAMASNLVRAGWGSGGSISFKVVPCAEVPPQLMDVAIDCDVLDPSSGKMVWDEVYEWWSSFKSSSALALGVREMQAALVRGEPVYRTE